MANIFTTEPTKKTTVDSGKNAYVSHELKGTKLAMVVDTEKLRESESGKTYTMYVSMVVNGRRIWGNFNVQK